MTYTIEEVFEALRQTSGQQRGAFDEFEGSALGNEPCHDMPVEDFASRVRRYFGRGIIETLVANKSKQQASELATAEHDKIPELGEWAADPDRERI